MNGLVLAEEGHIVNALPPIDITGGKKSDIFHMKHHSKCTAVVQIGVGAAAFTKVLVNACSANDGAGRTAIPYSVYKEETAAGDTLGARTAVAAAGLTPSAADTIMYVIEIEAAQLPDGLDWVEIELTNGTNSVIASILAILTGSRYGEEQSPTVLA